RRARRLELHRLWVKARMEERGTLYLKRPHPRLIVDASELSAALAVLYEQAGAPPLREFQQRAGGPLELPLSTLARIVSRQALPVSEKQYLAFLRACRATGFYEDFTEWINAWQRTSQRRPLTGSLAQIFAERIYPQPAI
ncbi:hypothetical protein ACWGA9_45370, partial [Streptomyces sp. NPDC054950]